MYASFFVSTLDGIDFRSDFSCFVFNKPIYFTQSSFGTLPDKASSPSDACYFGVTENFPVVFSVSFEFVAFVAFVLLYINWLFDSYLWGVASTSLFTSARFSTDVSFYLFLLLSSLLGIKSSLQFMASYISI
jgi:hypothetical protein